MAVRTESKRIMVKNMFPKRRRMMLWALLCVACLATLMPMVSAAARRGEVPAVRMLTDWRTGLALHGIDPVAYFSEGKAMLGLPEHELAFGGAVWRFLSEANQAAFLADPEVYAPRFAGRDPIAIARGVATHGNPLVWLLFGDRLYLFHTDAARDAFKSDPRRALAAATARWPSVMATLDGTDSLLTSPPEAGVGTTPDRPQQ